MQWLLDLVRDLLATFWRNLEEILGTLWQSLLDAITGWLGESQMAAASYTTDLTVISQADEASGTWAEPTATGWTSLNVTSFQETDFPLQGATTLYCVSGSVKTGVGGLLADAGASGITIPTDGAVLGWMYFGLLGAMDAAGAIRFVIGSGLAAFYAYKPFEKADYQYGGWRNLACADPANLTADYTLGAPTSTRRYFGWCYGATFATTPRGNPYGVDAFRYGRCEARMNGGDVGNGYATFAGFAAANDAATARWGLLQTVSGGYLWKGLINLGYSSAVDFRDSNKMIMIDDTRKVTAAFNKVEIRNASSRVDWANISFLCTAPSTTTSKGRLEVVDDCDVNMSGCVFTDMDTFIFKAASDVLTSVFRRCNTITANDAKFAGTLFDAASVAADTSQLIWDVNTDPNTDLNGCTFVKGANAHHAIEFGTTSPTSMTLTNVILTGFSASNAANDSAIHFKRTTGTVTLTITGGTSPSYKTDGTTIVIVTSSRTIKAIAQKADGTKIASARVFLKTAATASGGFPYNVTVTITNSGPTATVSHTAHGMLTNDKVVISGASLAVNNGVWTITKTTDDAYTYTMGSSPGSNPTGTIKCSFVFLEGETDGSGELSMSRAIGANQTVIGWVRKSSGSPYYKEGPLGGTVSSSGDSTFTAVLSPDE